MKDWLAKESGFALGKELVRERLKGSAMQNSAPAADPDFQLLRQAMEDINPQAKSTKSVAARKRVGAKSRPSAKARPGKPAARKARPVTRARAK